MRCYTMHHNGKTFWASSVKLYLCFYSSYSFVSSLPFYISHSLYMSLHLSSDVYIFLFNWARNKEYVFWLLIISILLCYFWISKQIDKSTFYAFTSKFPQNLLNKTSFYLSSSAFFLCKDNALEEPFHLVRIKLWENVSGPLMSTKCFKSIK